MFVSEPQLKQSGSERLTSNGEVVAPAEWSDESGAIRGRGANGEFGAVRLISLSSCGGNGHTAARSLSVYLKLNERHRTGLCEDIRQKNKHALSFTFGFGV